MHSMFISSSNITKKKTEYRHFWACLVTILMLGSLMHSMFISSSNITKKKNRVLTFLGMYGHNSNVGKLNAQYVHFFL